MTTIAPQRLWIDNASRDARSGETIRTENPATGEVTYTYSATLSQPSGSRARSRCSAGIA